MLPMGVGTHFIALPEKVRNNENLSLGQVAEVAFETRKRTAL
jgi:hypothetical protein